ncbi:MAG: DUF4390 domain-containing protein [Deltaproteobacteria bacterium]|nr:DUF4390 domain-containing protein [Deltaproteobacteria bacterium]
MVKRILYRAIFLIFSVLLVFTPPLSAENAGIRDLLVSNNANHVLVYARVINCFTKDIDAAILAGVPTTFTVLLDLYQERPHWMDKSLVRMTIRHTIKYDNVKKLFLVSADGEKEATAFPDFEGAKRAMADLNGVPIAQLKTLKRNEYYYVRVKAKLDKVRLPLHLEYVFFFVSLWDFETDWYRERFFY